jgi:Na+-translocating ferredoxin:NAD+ oxidoreductase RnfD subunit
LPSSRRSTCSIPEQNWWGALGELAPTAIALLFATGIFIADRVNKLPLVIVFLGKLLRPVHGNGVSGDARQVAEIFRAPDLHAVLFFAFFILTDPPTSPVKYPGQIVCGIIVAVVSSQRSS